jgi:nucleotide-binding universal stress UspA family protein
VRQLVVVGLLLSLGGLAHAQSLGEIARREQEKKKQTPGSPAPTYTEDDLTSRQRKGRGSVSELPVTGSPIPAASASPAPESDRARLEREWRARFAQARARIAEADARAYEDRIEVVFVTGIPVQQKVRVKVDTPELRDARKALDDLEEELRRSGGLPGWGRE